LLHAHDSIDLFQDDPTLNGKLVFELQNLGMPLTINPKAMKWGFNKSLQVVGFYIDNEKVSTYLAA
jgi:hypothetical protein